jgi:hypothetical protein
VSRAAHRAAAPTAKPEPRPVYVQAELPLPIGASA